MPISTVVTSMKNEAPYVIEWVAYHRALGFDRVVVLANDCTDGTHEMLVRLHEMGAISYYENKVPAGAKPHSRALKTANQTAEVKSADFVMVLDADEFLVVKKAPHKLNVLLHVMQNKSADMMVIPWRIFGSSHNTTFEDRPVIQRFTQSIDVSKLPKSGVKTLFRQADNLRLAIHFPKLLMKGGVPITSPSNKTWIDAGGNRLKHEKLTWNGGRQRIHRDFAEVAHFMIKSLDEYLLKILRGDGLMNSNRHGIGYWRSADHNQVSDLVVADNLPDFSEERDRLFADPALADLHRKAVAERFEKLGIILSNPNVQQLRDILKKSTAGKLQQEDIARSRELVTEMSPKIKVEKEVEWNLPHSTLLSITDAGLSDSSAIAGRMSKKAAENKTLFWSEMKFGRRPVTNLVAGLKDAEKDDRSANLTVRWFSNYALTAPKDGWPLDEEILVVLTRNDDQILSGYPAHITRSKAKYVQTSQDGYPPLRQILKGTETAAEVKALIAGGQMADPRLGFQSYIDENPQAIVLNLDHPEKVAEALAVIETRGPSGHLAAKLLRESLAMDLPVMDAVSPQNDASASQGDDRA